jgi:hypothetical protein
MAGKTQPESGQARRWKRRKGGSRDTVGPAYQMYASDWNGSRHIALMTPEQEGGFIHLLNFEWDDPDCALPDDDGALTTLSRLGERWPTLQREIRDCFVPHPRLRGRLVNPRLFAQWREARAYRRQQSESGRHGALKRWDKDGAQPLKELATDAKRSMKGASRHGKPTRVAMASPSPNDGSPLSASALRSSSPFSTASATGSGFKKGNGEGEDQEREAAHLAVAREILISDITEFTRETGRTPLYRRIIENLGEDDVRVVLSRCKEVRNPENRGAVFTSKAKERATELGIDLGIGE